jgi:hydrogenase nickel incorporation protein HypA/HybF
MHELSIARVLLETVREEAERRPGAIPVKVAVRVGELSGVDAEALRFSFHAILRGTDWQDLVLEIEPQPWRRRCLRCHSTFRVLDFRLDCPTCGASNTEAAGGDELDVLYLELKS